MKKFLIFAALACAALSVLLTSCGNEAPELDEVRETFVSLIEASREVNDIFFGEGLPTYERFYADVTMSYDEASGTYYVYYEDTTAGRILKYYDNTEKTNKYLSVVTVEGGASPAEGYVYSLGNDYYYESDYTEPEGYGVYDASSPTYYDYVRADSDYQSVESLKELAESVYSDAYLSGIYTTVFDGYAADGIGLIRARYMNDESGDGSFFLKSNEYEPLFEEQTVYDTSSMRILSSSKRDRVTVELDATGRYLDYNTLEPKTRTTKKQLTFVLNKNGEWRLDTPTY